MSTTTTSSRSGRPGSEILCAPSTDPTGFIYSSYQAAQTETHVDKPPLKDSHQPSAYVSSSVGGSVSTLSFRDTTTKKRLSPSRHRRGGIRDKVRASPGQAVGTSSDVSLASIEERLEPSEGASSS
jgi:hypothetical protein